MATSPIYSWPEPDNTDLVKNGALAIRTLGNAIDTTMGTMVAKTIIDAKGDLIAGTAADTAARLAVGNNGETLVADSSTSTGLRYQTGYNANAVINGGMDIWQRGTSFTANTGYTADRWYKSGVAGRTYTRQTTSDTTNLPTIQYCLRASRDSGNTATDNIVLSSSLESVDAQKFVGQTVTLSFYARKGANFSPSSSNIIARLYSGTGTDQNVEVSYTGSAAVINQSAVLTTTWQRFQYTATVGTTATELAVWFAAVPTGTAGAADYFEITGIQLELGSIASTFKRAKGGTIQGETSACQRYYVRLGANNGGTTGAYSTYGNGYSTTSTDASINITLPTTMRIPPTVCEFSNVAIQDFNTAVIAVSNVTMNSAFVSTTVAVVAATTVGATQFRGCKLSNNNNTAGYVGFSAEL